MLAAALELAGEVGVVKMSMDELAERAGVSKATVYRRWSSKEALILDALRTAINPMQDVDTGALRRDLELYLDEEGYPRRAAGEVLCGTTLDLGRLRLDCAFFAWHMEGREGVGRYDVLRRA